jgi:hypothetical protein
MFILLLILLVSLFNFFIGTFIPPNEERNSKGEVGWNGKID